MIVGVLTGIVLLGVGVVWYLAYGLDTDAPESLRMAGVHEETTIIWSDTGDATIHAESVHDFLAALGFVHGTNHTWSILLARQAALGRLSEWYGQESLPEDRLVRRLRLAEDARDAYSRMDSAEKRGLEIFSMGISTAIRSRQVRMKAPLVLMEIDPDPWLPWHSIAVERLWAWIAAPVQSLDPDSDGMRELMEADRSLRTRLHLFGFENDVLIALGYEEEEASLFRYVTGDSGVPVFQSFGFSRAGAEVMRGLSVPGTLIFPAGRMPDFSWSLLLDTDISSVESDILIEESEITYDRIRDTSGKEEIVEVLRVGNRMPVPSSGISRHTESVHVLDWMGFQIASDTHSWLALLEGHPPVLSLFRRDGLLTPRGEVPIIMGSPAVSRRFASGIVLASNMPSGTAVADRLAALDSSSVDQTPWDILHDSQTTVFRHMVGDIVSILEAQTRLTSAEADALSYIRNWDSRFSPESIAASILDATARSWSTLSNNDEPTGSPLDHLRTGLDDLIATFGTDMSKWRWETVQDRRVYFPGWLPGSGDNIRHVRQFYREFEPVHLPGRGHPSTLSWGPSSHAVWRMASSSWEGYWRTRSGSAFEFERPDVQYTSFLGRFMAENRTIRTVRTGDSDRTKNSTSIRPLR